MCFFSHRNCSSPLKSILAHETATEILNKELDAFEQTHDLHLPPGEPVIKSKTGYKPCPFILLYFIQFRFLLCSMKLRRSVKIPLQDVELFFRDLANDNCRQLRFSLTFTFSTFHIARIKLNLPGVAGGRVWVRLGRIRFSARKALIKTSKCSQISSFLF